MKNMRYEPVAHMEGLAESTSLGEAVGPQHITVTRMRGAYGKGLAIEGEETHVDRFRLPFSGDWTR